VSVEEARRVIERLERIEELRRAEAPAPVLLAEVRSLLAEGERWLSVEHADGRTLEALDRCRASIEGPPS
jgi:hypothetical protein